MPTWTIPQNQPWVFCMVFIHFYYTQQMLPIWVGLSTDLKSLQNYMVHRTVSHSGLKFKRHFQKWWRAMKRYEELSSFNCVAKEHKNVQIRHKLRSVHTTAMASTIPTEQQRCVLVQHKPQGLHNPHFKSAILHSLENLPACLGASTGTKSQTRTKAEVSLYSCTVIHTLKDMG